MQIVDTATNWAKDEAIASSFFILFGLVFLLASWMFSHSGKTDLAKALVLPMLVAGGLLIVIGAGLIYSNYMKFAEFSATGVGDAQALVTAELARVETVMKQYKIAVFMVIPAIIVLAAILLALINAPLWRAISATTLATMVVVVLIDANANARLETYHKQLKQSEIVN